MNILHNFAKEVIALANTPGQIWSFKANLSKFIMIFDDQFPHKKDLTNDQKLNFCINNEN